MANKDKKARAIDKKQEKQILSGSGFNVLVASSTNEQIPDGPIAVEATSLILYSSIEPSVGIRLSWVPPNNNTPTNYTVQYSLDNNFDDDNNVSLTVAATTILIDNLKPNTLYYLRVASNFDNMRSQWSVPISITTVSDTAPPNPVTSINWDWYNSGDLTIRWSNPSNKNFKDVRVEIWNNTKTVKYVDVHVVGTSYTFTAQQNLDLAGGIAAVHVELTARSYGNVYSTVAVPSTQPTKAKPSTPTGVTSDFNSRNAVFSWSAATGAYDYIVTINGKPYVTRNLSYTYTYEQNKLDNINPDPTLSYTITARDGILQLSTPTSSATATNPTPPQITGVVSSWDNDAGYFDSSVTVSWESYTKPLDFEHFKLEIADEADTVGATLYLQDNRITFTYDEISEAFSGTTNKLKFKVQAVDAFNQSGTLTTKVVENVEPPQPLINAFAGFTSIAVTIVNAQKILDFDHYLYKLYKGGTSGTTDGTVVKSIVDVIDTPQFTVSEIGNYKVSVIVYDKFQQASTEIVSDLMFIDALTLEQLRSEGQYSDSIGTDFTSEPTGKARNLLMKDNATGSGISYSNSSWQWIQFDRPLEKLYRRLTFKFGTGNPNVYFVTGERLEDGTESLKYWSNVSGNGYTLTSYSTEANARTNAKAANSYIYGFAEIPVEAEALWVRLYFNPNGSTVRLDEFYPRSMIISDDIQAESIKALQIAANAVVADKIAAGAVTANKLSVGVGGGNLLRNSGFIFDSNNDGLADEWSIITSSGGAIANYYNNPPLGTKYQFVRNTNSSAQLFGLTQTIGIQPSMIYTASFYTIVDALSPDYIIIQMRWLQSDATTVISTDISPNLTPVNGRLSFTATAPSNAAYLELRILGSGPTDDRLVVYAVQVEQGDVLTTWKPTFTGNVQIDGQGIMVGTYNAARTVITSGGIVGYNSSNTEQVIWDSSTGVIRTGTASGARVVLSSDGLSSFNSSNVLQVRLNSSDGSFEAGAGNVRLDSSGVSILSGAVEGVWSSVNGYTFRNAQGYFGGVYGNSTIRMGGRVNTISLLQKMPNSSGNTLGEIEIVNEGITPVISTVYISARRMNTTNTVITNAYIQLRSDDSSAISTSNSILLESRSDQVYIDSPTAVNFRLEGTTATVMRLLPNEIKINKPVTSSVTLSNGALGSTNGSEIVHMNMFATVVNANYLRFKVKRIATGTVHETAANIIQRVTDVTNQAYISFLGNSIGINIENPSSSWALSVNGDAAKVGGGSWSNISSDIRTKKDIKPYELSIDQVTALEPVWYTYNGKAGTPEGSTHIGFIAQDVLKHVPDMVSEVEVYLNEGDTDKTKILTVNNDPLLYGLLNSVKWLYKRVLELEKQKGKE